METEFQRNDQSILLPQNLEYYNPSHLTLTMTQSRTLGFSLKFGPTRQPPAARVFDNQISKCSVTLRVCIQV